MRTVAGSKIKMSERMEAIFEIELDVSLDGEQPQNTNETYSNTEENVVLQPVLPEVLVISANDTFQGESDSIDFTQNSNECFYRPTAAEIEFIASQATAQSTKEQTKWAVKIVKGMWTCARYFFP